jgi:hypothetical protein
MKHHVWTKPSDHRRYYIGGGGRPDHSGQRGECPLQLWREKRGEVEPEDLSDNLIVQLGLSTDRLNRQRYERRTRPSKRSSAGSATP